MDSNDDFFDGMKSEKDKAKEWADAAQYFVDIRREPEAPPQEPEKTAGARELAQGAGKVLTRLDPTGLARTMSSSKDALVAGLAGAGLFGVGTALASRGKKELGGQSTLEHTLAQAKADRASKPEAPSFMGKMRDHMADLSAGVASTARKHPVAASLAGAVGGAKAGTSILKLLTSRKA